MLSLTAAIGRPAHTAEPQANQLLVGRSAVARLDDRIGVTWSRTRLRDAVGSLTRSTQLAVVLDRRVDPERRIDFSAVDQPIRAVVEQLAHRSGTSAVWIGPTAYIGPAAVERLPAIAAERRRDASRLPVELRKALQAERPLAWPDLAEPRRLLEQLAAEAGLRPTNSAAIPHDLWYRATTAPLPLSDRLTIVAGQFDRTYRIDAAAKTITFEPWPEQGATFAAPPPSTVSPRATAPNKKPSHTTETRVFTLRIRGVPLSRLIYEFRNKHGLDVRVDEEAIRRAGLTLDRPTDVDVERQPLEVLLDRAARPLGLAARRTGEAVEIVPAAEAQKNTERGP